MGRDDLRLLGALVRLLWRRRVYCRHDATRIALDDALWVYCWRCGYQSPGVTIETAAVQRAWAFDRMRLRFRRKAS